MNLRVFGSILAIGFLLAGCNGNRVFEEYEGLKSGTWHVSDTVSFEVPKLQGPNSTLVGIKYTKDYGFRNLYVRYILKDSLGKEIETKLLDIPLFESTTGQPLGEGYGGTFTKYDTLPLDNAYSSIHLVQYMRVEELPGIETVGLKVVKK
ncbi:gliding motility lipoprotein GldH [Cognataquiflexum rubidum]|uniref:gliding motility lipoprotein GldH n=1 Tax=Cognataquiflexum rubidum TaxID=2922273 RepID=UPI001F12A0B0|nr:gliding motility lipoprotein GldH [Cognataquiflexum rubidum]MCH6235214.1 gliding motility lipoprotein GldH [Cognataquiflexum rubidum]